MGILPGYPEGCVFIKIENRLGSLTPLFALILDEHVPAGGWAMSVHLLIPGFPGKSSKAGHSGEAELAGFQMGPRQIGEMIQWTRLKPGSTGAFSVVLDLTENADFWYRLRIAEATEMKIPLAWVIPGPQITYMFWGVRVSGFIVGNDGASSTILFEFEGVSGSYTRS